MSLPCLEVRLSARARAAVTIRILLVSAVSLLVTIGVSNAANPGIIDGTHDGEPAAIISELPPDHPVGTKATVTLISLKRARHPDEPFLSTFIVDYLPGGGGRSASVAERGICPCPRAFGNDPSAGMGGGHGHLSFRANLGRAGRRQ